MPYKIFCICIYRYKVVSILCKASSCRVFCFLADYIYVVAYIKQRTALLNFDTFLWLVNPSIFIRFFHYCKPSDLFSTVGFFWFVLYCMSSYSFLTVQVLWLVLYYTSYLIGSELYELSDWLALQRDDFSDALAWFDLSERLGQSESSEKPAGGDDVTMRERKGRVSLGKLHRNKASCYISLNQLDKVSSRRF